MRLRNYLGTIILYIVVFAIILAVLFIYYFNKKIGPSLITCATDEVKHLTILVMNNCVNKYIDEVDDLSVLKIGKDGSGDIERVQYDVKMLNEIRTRVTEMLEIDLELMTDGKIDEVGLNMNKLSDEYYEMNDEGILFTVSMGSAMGNNFFANIGPKIPLNLQVNGDVVTNIDTKVTEYGMNNAMVEVLMTLQVVIIVNMPFLSDEVVVENTVPLSMEIIQGDVLSYYLGGMTAQ